MLKPKHILVIRLSAMGDVAMTVPVLSVLTATYPELKVTVVSRAFFKPLFQGIPNCNFLEADVYGKHKGLGLLKLANQAKALGIDAVADIHNVLRSKIIRNDLCFRGIKAATIDKGRTQKKELTKSVTSKIIRPLITTHQRYAAVFETLGFPLHLDTFQPIQKGELTQELHTLIGKHSKKLIGIAPFAAYKSKTYPRSLLKGVLQDLNNTQKFKVFLFGNASEKQQLETLSTSFEHATVVAGQFSFKDELKLISNLDCMLSMDSGNGHLAANYGIPVITLWGVTHPYAGFRPFNQPDDNQLISNRERYPLIPTSVYGNKFPKGYENVMESIPPALLVEKVKSILD